MVNSDNVKANHILKSIVKSQIDSRAKANNGNKLPVLAFCYAQNINIEKSSINFIDLKKLFIKSLLKIKKLGYNNHEQMFKNENGKLYEREGIYE